MFNVGSTVRLSGPLYAFVQLTTCPLIVAVTMSCTP